MYCSRCGKKTPDGARFCSNCGADLSGQAGAPSAGRAWAAPPPVNYAAPQARRRRRGPLVLILCALVLVAGIAVAAVLFFGRDGYAGNYQYQKDSIMMNVPESHAGYADFGELIRADGTRVPVDPMLINDSAAIYYSSADGTRAPLVGTSQLGYYNGKGIESFNSSFGVSFLSLSYDGTAFLYLTNGADGSPESLQYVYFEKDKQRSQQFYFSGGNIYTALLSPHGDTALFYLSGDGSGLTNATPGMYIWKKGKDPVMVDNAPYGAASVTDDGEVIYHLDENGRLCAWTKEGDICLSADETVYIHSRCYTANNRELLYDDNTGGAICVDGKRIVRLSSSECWPLLPNNAELFQYSIDAFDHYMGIRSYAGSFIIESSANDYSTYNILFVDKKYEVHRVLEGVSKSTLANDGKTILYVKDGLLYKIDGTKADAAPVQLSVSAVDDFDISPDGKTIFYIDKLGILYVVKDGRSAKVDENVYFSVSYNYGLNMTGDTLYYIKESVLYSTDGGTPRSYQDEFGYNVNDVWSDGLSVDVTVYDGAGTEREYRKMTDGTFTLIREHNSYY